eukprot:1871993-Alexandrium_andersonii.AAC.1
MPQSLAQASARRRIRFAGLALLLQALRRAARWRRRSRWHSWRTRGKAASQLSGCTRTAGRRA